MVKGERLKDFLKKILTFIIIIIPWLSINLLTQR